MMQNLAYNFDLQAALTEFPNGRLLFSYVIVVGAYVTHLDVKCVFHSGESTTVRTPFEPGGSADFTLTLTRALIQADIGG